MTPSPSLVPPNSRRREGSLGSISTVRILGDSCLAAEIHLPSGDHLEPVNRSPVVRGLVVLVAKSTSTRSQPLFPTPVWPSGDRLSGDQHVALSNARRGSPFGIAKSKSPQAYCLPSRRRPARTILSSRGDTTNPRSSRKSAEPGTRPPGSD